MKTGKKAIGLWLVLAMLCTCVLPAAAVQMGEEVLVCLQSSSVPSKNEGFTELSSGWFGSDNATGLHYKSAYGTPGRCSQGTGAMAKVTASLPADGRYEVFYYVSGHSADTPSLALEISSLEGSQTRFLDLSVEANRGFQSIGTYNLAAGENTVGLSSDKQIRFSAMKFVYQGELQLPELLVSQYDFYPDSRQIKRVPFGTQVQSFLENVVPSQGVSRILQDGQGREKTTGTVAAGDKVVTDKGGERKEFAIRVLPKKIEGLYYQEDFEDYDSYDEYKATLAKWTPGSEIPSESDIVSTIVNEPEAGNHISYTSKTAAGNGKPNYLSIPLEDITGKFMIEFDIKESGFTNGFINFAAQFENQPLYTQLYGGSMNRGSLSRKATNNSGSNPVRWIFAHGEKLFPQTQWQTLRFYFDLDGTKTLRVFLGETECVFMDEQGTAPAGNETTCAADANFDWTTLQKIGFGRHLEINGNAGAVFFDNIRVYDPVQYAEGLIKELPAAIDVTNQAALGAVEQARQRVDLAGMVGVDENSLEGILHLLDWEAAIKEANYPVTSAVYTVDQAQRTVMDVPSHTTAAAFVQNLTPAADTTLKVMRNSDELTEGPVETNDLLVASKSGAEDVTYVITVDGELFSSAAYRVDHENKTIGVIPIDTTAGEVKAALIPADGVTLAVKRGAQVLDDSAVVEEGDTIGAATAKYEKVYALAVRQKPFTASDYTIDYRNGTISGVPAYLKAAAFEQYLTKTDAVTSAKLTDSGGIEKGPDEFLVTGDKYVIVEGTAETVFLLAVDQPMIAAKDDYYTIDHGQSVITKVDADTTAGELKAQIVCSDGVTLTIKDGNGELTDAAPVATGNRLLAAKNGIIKSYTISVDQRRITSSVYHITYTGTKLVENVDANTTVEIFLGNLSADTGVSLSVRDGQALKNPDDPVVTGDTLAAAKYGRELTYEIRVNPAVINITSEIYTIDQGLLTIQDVPYGTTAAQLKAGLVKNSDSVVLTVMRGQSIVSDSEKMATGDRLETQNGSAQKVVYTITVDPVLFASGSYQVDHDAKTIGTILPGVTAGELKAALIAASGVTLKVTDGQTEKSDDEEVTAGDFLAAVKNEKETAYTIFVEEKLFTSGVYTVDYKEKTLGTVPRNTTVAAFLADLVPAGGAVLKVLEGQVEKEETSVVKNNDILRAVKGNLIREYTIAAMETRPSNSLGGLGTAFFDDFSRYSSYEQFKQYMSTEAAPGKTNAYFSDPRYEISYPGDDGNPYMRFSNTAGTGAQIYEPNKLYQFTLDSTKTRVLNFQLYNDGSNNAWFKFYGYFTGYQDGESPKELFSIHADGRVISRNSANTAAWLQNEAGSADLVFPKNEWTDVKLVVSQNGDVQILLGNKPCLVKIGTEIKNTVPMGSMGDLIGYGFTRQLETGRVHTGYVGLDDVRIFQADQPAITALSQLPASADQLADTAMQGKVLLANQLAEESKLYGVDPAKLDHYDTMRFYYNLIQTMDDPIVLTSENYTVAGNTISGVLFDTTVADFAAFLPVPEGCSYEIAGKTGTDLVATGDRLTLKKIGNPSITETYTITVDGYLAVTGGLALDREQNIISSIPYGTTKEEFLRLLTYAAGAQVKIYTGETENNGVILDQDVLKLTLKDQEIGSYLLQVVPAAQENTLVSAGEYTLTETSISNVPYNTPFQEFKQQLTLPFGAAAVYPYHDHFAGNLTTDFTMKVMAQNGAEKEYQVFILPGSTDTTLTSSQYQVDVQKKVITGVEAGVSVAQFLSEIGVPAGAKAVYYNLGGKAADAGTVTGGDTIRVYPQQAIPGIPYDTYVISCNPADQVIQEKIVTVLDTEECTLYAQEQGENKGWFDSSAAVAPGYNNIPPKYLAGEGYARFRPNIPEDGVYQVYVYTSYHSSNPAADLDIYPGDGTVKAASVPVDFKDPISGWKAVGEYSFLAGSSGYVEFVNPGMIRISAVRFLKVGHVKVKQVQAKVSGVSSVWEEGANQVQAGVMQLDVAFELPMNPATLTPQTVKIKTENGYEISYTGQFDQEKNVYHLITDYDLIPGMTYTVQVADGVQAANGAPLSKNYTYLVKAGQRAVESNCHVLFYDQQGKMMTSPAGAKSAKASYLLKNETSQPQTVNLLVAYYQGSMMSQLAKKEIQIPAGEEIAGEQWFTFQQEAGGSDSVKLFVWDQNNIPQAKVIYVK